MIVMIVRGGLFDILLCVGGGRGDVGSKFFSPLAGMGPECYFFTIQGLNVFSWFVGPEDIFP